MARLIVTADLILSCLPDAPAGMRHTVSKHSARVYKVSLHYPAAYAPLSRPDGGQTTWGFVTSTGQVKRPKNSKTPGDEVCHILDAGELSGYTSIIPTETVITD
ncbi:hypothetical protein SCREM2_gp57 [Synechococcus phage S-CREM2]|nr:hypothetical protein SCREM2_gp57 [Synechococcus phage S-CREM2]